MNKLLIYGIILTIVVIVIVIYIKKKSYGNAEVIIIGSTLLKRYNQTNTATTYTIPSNVTTIGDAAFYNCKNLTTVTIPSNVRTIGDYAFQNCTNLESVTISGSGVITIREGAFDNCVKLKSFKVGDFTANVMIDGTSVKISY